MTDIVFSNALLVTYDLQSSLHGDMRRLLRTEFGDEGDRWVRIQDSIVIVKTGLTPRAFKDLFDIYVGKGAGKIFIIDVSESKYSGYGKKAGWSWLSAAQKEIRASRTVHASAYWKHYYRGMNPKPGEPST